MAANPSFADSFRHLTGHEPWPFQLRVAEALRARRNVLVSAPTGCGKTLAALAPFLLCREEIGVSRLIYVLPLRTLVNSIHAQAAALAEKFGLVAKIQTGETPEDPYYEAGITVTTFDQLLSGFLGAPYSLPSRLYNMNCAAVAGALVVFDEFHLMEPDKAFATAVSMMKLFRESSRSVWMTATATEPLKDHLERQLGVERVDLNAEEREGAYRGRGIQRIVRRRDETLRAEHLLEHPGTRRLAVVNQVGAAQRLLEELRANPPSDVAPENIVLLHARFFASDRRAKQEKLQRLFNRGSTASAIAIATQVVEAGVDISAEHLYTEVCPVNSLVQRSGRCARYAGERGVIHVFRDDRGRPYAKEGLQRAWVELVDGSDLSPDLAAEWVNAAHRDSDRADLGTAMRRDETCGDVIRSQVTGVRGYAVSPYIRKGSDTVRLLILQSPQGAIPASREGLSIYRAKLAEIERAGGQLRRYDPDAPGLWAESHAGDRDGFVFAVSPAIARYSSDSGLWLGMAGTVESPEVTIGRTPWAPLRVESWRDHTRTVAERAATLVDCWAGSGSLVEKAHPELGEALRAAAIGHDLGKLQRTWQEWATSYQTGHGAAEPAEPLAHTDWDWNNPAHRQAEAAASPKRPPHSFASAWYFRGAIRQKPWALEVLLSIVSHHGGWEPPGLAISLCESTTALLAEFGHPDWGKRPPGAIDREDFFRQLAEELENEFETRWPFAALLVRLLRIADQKATREAGSSE